MRGGGGCELGLAASLMAPDSLFDDARQRAEALLRLASAPDAPPEFPSDLPYIMATEYMALWEAFDRTAHALEETLDAAERARVGFAIESEEWYARRDYARIQLRFAGRTKE